MKKKILAIAITLVLVLLTIASYIPQSPYGVAANLTAQTSVTVTNANTYYPIGGTFTNDPIRGFSTVADPAIQYDGSADTWFEIDWIGSNWHHMYYDTDSDEEGYYSIYVPAGELSCYFYKHGYQWGYHPRKDIGENETLWFNFTMQKYQNPIEIYLYRPINGLYLKNELKLPFFKPLIIGDFEIELYVWGDYEIENVELYIDNELKPLIRDDPDSNFYTYSWTKEKTKLFGHRHTIKVVATDEKGNVETEEIKVWKYL